MNNTYYKHKGKHQERFDKLSYEVNGRLDSSERLTDENLKAFYAILHIYNNIHRNQGTVIDGKDFNYYFTVLKEYLWNAHNFQTLLLKELDKYGLLNYDRDKNLFRLLENLIDEAVEEAYEHFFTDESTDESIIVSFDRFIYQKINENNKFDKLEFKENNQYYEWDTLTGYVDKDTKISYMVAVRGNKEGFEKMVIYSGVDYVEGSLKKESKMRIIEKNFERSKYFVLWNDLKNIYLEKYK